MLSWEYVGRNSFLWNYRPPPFTTGQPLPSKNQKRTGSTTPSFTRVTGSIAQPFHHFLAPFRKHPGNPKPAADRVQH